MHAEGSTTVSELHDRLLHDPACMERLLLDLSINVTAMFRDPGFYARVPRAGRAALRTYPFIRIWHAGCSTGEEVYSLAILLEEEGLYDRTRIYATDINEQVLDTARAGIFPLDKMQEYTENYIQAGGKRAFSEYYTPKYDGALFSRSLTENVVFAQHNLVTDRSFNEFNVIVCRNVMIYFDKTLQDRVHRLFYESLSTFGMLALGRKESIAFTPYADCYEVVDARSASTGRPREVYEIIVIGTSWGGLEALEPAARRHARRRAPPIVVAQHRSAESEDFVLEGLLQHHTRRVVRDADDKTKLERGHVYIAPPDYHLLVEDGHLALSTDEPVQFARPSIDVLFESVADAYARAFGRRRAHGRQRRRRARPRPDQGARRRRDRAGARHVGEAGDARCRDRRDGRRRGAAARGDSGVPLRALRRGGRVSVETPGTRREHPPGRRPSGEPARARRRSSSRSGTSSSPSPPARMR